MIVVTTVWRWPLVLHTSGFSECDFSTKDTLLVISMDYGYGSVFLTVLFPWQGFQPGVENYGVMLNIY